MPVKTRLALGTPAVLVTTGCSAAPAAAPAPPPQSLTATLTTPTDIDLHWPEGDPRRGRAPARIAELHRPPVDRAAVLPALAAHLPAPDLIPETPFFYRVRDFFGPVSAVVQPGSPAHAAPPATAVPVWKPGKAAAPADVTVVPAEDASVHFTWADRSSDEAGFLVEIRTPGQAGFVPVEITDSDTTTCALSLLPDEQGSAFRVRALYYRPLSPVVDRTTGQD